MKITVFGATGMVGNYVVQQALQNGLQVNAFGRNVDKLIDKAADNELLTAIKGYVFNEEDVLFALQDVDAVISVLGGSITGEDKTRSLGVKNICTQMAKAKVNRIAVLGGMGILNAADNTLLLDSKDYPEQYKAVGTEHLRALHFLEASNLDYVCIGAPNILDAPFTGKYITCANYVPEPNFNAINAGDLADCLLQQVIQPTYHATKIGISKY